MKILTVCEGGSCRSVAMLYELRDRYGHDVLHIGTKPVGYETKLLVCSWADLILLADKSMLEAIPEYERYKTHWLNMPEDLWHDPKDQKLRKKIRGQISQHDSPEVRRLMKGTK